MENVLMFILDLFFLLSLRKWAKRRPKTQAMSIAVAVNVVFLLTNYSIAYSIQKMIHTYYNTIYKIELEITNENFIQNTWLRQYFTFGQKTQPVHSFLILRKWHFYSILNYRKTGMNGGEGWWQLKYTFINIYTI